MSYGSERNNTNKMLKQLTERNASGIEEMRAERMPTLVPIQEKDWDTMVELLQAAVDFQPKVYELMETLPTVKDIEELHHAQDEIIRGYCNSHLKLLKEQMNEKLGESEKILKQMKANEEAAGKSLERIMNASVARGKELEEAILEASEGSDTRTWLIRTACTVIASAASALFGALLCMRWLG